MNAARKLAELDCLLEVQVASGSQVDEVATALAEELEIWLLISQQEPEDVEAAIELAKQLRLLGWLVSVDLGGVTAKMMDQLEQLMARAGELTQPPTVSGARRNLPPGSPESMVVRLTPPVPVSLAQLYGAEDDEQTVVKKAQWVAPRSANRILEKDDPGPPAPPR